MDLKLQKETEEKITKLQLLEQNLQAFLIQKQTLQLQLSEINNALEELKKAKGETYKIVGTIMVSSEKTEIEKDLNSKKELIELKIKNLEKQEYRIREEITPLQTEILKKIRK